jgi:hypothetical protein
MDSLSITVTHDWSHFDAHPHDEHRVLESNESCATGVGFSYLSNFIKDPGGLKKKIIIPLRQNLYKSAFLTDLSIYIFLFCIHNINIYQQRSFVTFKVFYLKNISCAVN